MTEIAIIQVTHGSGLTLVPTTGDRLDQVFAESMTDDERKAVDAALAALGNVYDRLSKVEADESLQAAYEAHPEIGAKYEASAVALAKANARLVELGEKPVEVPDDAKAESPEKSTAPQGFAQPITTRGL